jgi:hypothetical protein
MKVFEADDAKVLATNTNEPKLEAEPESKTHLSHPHH